MRLCVGIVGGNVDGWHLLLQQEGIPHDLVSDGMKPDAYSAIVAGDGIDDRMVQLLRAFLKDRGGVVCTGRVYAALSNRSPVRMPVKYVVCEKGSLFNGIGLVDIYSECQLPPDAHALRTHTGQPAAFAGKFGGGHIVALPFDPSSLVLDCRTATKSFYASARRLPFEHVSLVSKGSLRKLVSRSLEVLHHRKGLPYVHAWYYPSGAPTLFSFRIDTDYASRSEIEFLYDLLQRNGIHASWFVEVKSQESFLQVFRAMEGQEFGIHCYDHQTYPDVDRNLANIRKALFVSESHGLHAKGFAAPFGHWNDGLAQAVGECGFDYSSEFSYDYDNLPSFPNVRGSRSTVLQVSIHPISIGSLRRQGMDERSMVEYFRTLLESKLKTREPMFVYHHPRDGHPRVLQSLFDFVYRHQLRSVRMSDYADWWRRRSERNLRIDVSDSTITATDVPSDESMWLRISRQDGRETLTPMRSSIDLETLTWTRTPEPMPLPSDMHRIRKFNPWIPLIRAEDFLFKKLMSR